MRIKVSKKPFVCSAYFLVPPIATTITRLEMFQSRILCYVQSSPWFVRNDAIRWGLKITTLSTFMCSLVLNVLNHDCVSSYLYL